MEAGKLYRLKRGNQTQAVGFIVKGVAASLQILGSQSKPALVADMVDCTDSELLTEGTWSFSMLPEYITFVGGSDDIQIIGMGYEELSDIA